MANKKGPIDWKLGNAETALRTTKPDFCLMQIGGCLGHMMSCVYQPKDQQIRCSLDHSLAAIFKPLHNVKIHKAPLPKKV